MTYFLSCFLCAVTLQFGIFSIALAQGQGLDIGSSIITFLSLFFTFLWVGLPLLFRKPNAPRSWKILLLIAFWASLVNVILLPAIANYLPEIEFSSVVIGRLWIIIAFPVAAWGISGGVGAVLIRSVLLAALLWWMHGVIAKRLNA